MMTSLKLPPSGLPTEAGVRSHPGPTAEYDARLLAHGVGVPILLHHNAYQPGGEEQGESGRVDGGRVGEWEDRRWESERVDGRVDGGRVGG